ncbi:MAG: hypothetical protein EOL90_11270, partial [Spartobacteria bacterium]|nr:hypothetical protein [Spartobacteria bacterium]
DPGTERIDYDAVEKLAAEHKPRLICAGASAYSRIIDFKRLRAIADSVGALLLVDMAHIAGLVAAVESAEPFAGGRGARRAPARVRRRRPGAGHGRHSARPRRSRGRGNPRLERTRRR